MSNSSSSSSNSPDPYEVFLSFRGVDTRQNFTSHLLEALNQKKIKTFIDDKLKSGDEISPALMKAIQESHASIIIFSENYASSKWCLEELIKILECKENEGQLVIPVFYKVEPSHVRWQNGSYKQAFEEHEQNNKEKVQQWRAALNKAANLSGWTWNSESDRTESEFIKDIVGDVLKKLDPGYPIELKGLVGIEESCAEIESLLEIGGSEVWSIGIWGMGGIGKTTLATAVYAKLYSSFEGHCFVANVREESEKINGLNALRNKLFSELLKKENLNSNTLGALSKFDMTRLRRTKVFIVLDDVATLQQLEDLILDYHWGSGSRVIITTRNRHVCSIVNGIYKVKLLSDDDCVKLFCANAFGEKLPKNGYGELLKGMITYCKGNPLALKVLGARLRGRSKEVWKSELRKLETIPNPKIQNVLKLSYDDLDDTEKNIFLDIACFYKGKSVGHVTSLLRACDLFPDSGIPVLLDMTLITISYGNIQMHDLIQKMGRTIVREESIYPGRRSRLWNPEEVYDVLKYNRGTEMVKGIRLNLSKIGDLNLSSDPFSKMINLRIIEFYFANSSDKCNVYLPDGLGSLPDTLRNLRWDGYCLRSLPPTFCPKMIVKISMPDSKLEKLWDGVQEFQNLKMINLNGSKHLVEVPDLSMAPNLVQVYLTRCVSLRHIHPSILSRPKLKYLTFIACEKIESLTNDIHLKSVNNLQQECCSSLKQFSATTEALEHLDLSIHPYCCNLKTLTDNIGLLSSLQNLILTRTNVQRLPSDIKNLSMLRELCIASCKKLVFVPELPPSLEELYAGNCTSLEIIINLNTVEFVDGLPCLRSLNLSSCRNLQILPDSIGLLSSLEDLALSGTNVERLSSNIKNLSMLRWLYIAGCTKLVFVPELPPSLEVLSARDCTSLEIIFNLNTIEIVDGLPSLKSLNLSSCCNLQIVPDSIGLLSSLEDLDLSGTNVERLSSNIKNLSMLRWLYVAGCMKLVFVPELPPSLEVFSSRDCTSLEIIFNLNTVEIVDGLPSLRRLDLSNCCNLQILPESIGLLSSLKDLDLSGTNVERLSSNIKNLSMLQRLNISDCRKLLFVPELPPSLKDFRARNRTSVQEYYFQPDFEDSQPRNQMLDEKDSFDCFMGEGTKERGDLSREGKKEWLLGGITQYNFESNAQSLNKQKPLRLPNNLKTYKRRKLCTQPLQ